MFRFIRLGFLKNHIYKQAIIMRILANLLTTITLIAIWKAIGRSEALPLSTDQFITYSIYAMFISSVYNLNVVGTISSSVRSGDIIFYISKPKSLCSQIFFETLGGSLFKLCYIAVPSLLILVLTQGGTSLYVENFFPAIMVFVLSYLFMFFIEAIFGMLSIFALNAWGLQSLKISLIAVLSGQLIPLALYPDNLKRMVESLPFTKLYSYPILLLLGEDTFYAGVFVEYLYVFLVLGALYAVLSTLVLRRVAINGG